MDGTVTMTLDQYHEIIKDNENISNLFEEIKDMFSGAIIIDPLAPVTTITIYKDLLIRSLLKANYEKLYKSNYEIIWED